jgi:head-tail adaptor
MVWRPPIDVKRRVSVPEIGELNKRVWVCTTVEKPDMNVSTIKRRPGVIEVHARIRPLRGQEILDYQAVLGEENKPTTEITIRDPPDVKVDIRHWIYHEGLYARTWYKVRTVEDLGGVGLYLLMRCSVDQILDVRSDPATQETPRRWEDPGGPRVPDTI